ncbi:MAG: glycoside hydrolase family 31 protein [Kiritimatiellae bacterium]|nr:glycoside hydrolase family 31 protein [Kiritimatiellia bacterium]
MDIKVIAMALVAGLSGVLCAAEMKVEKLGEDLWRVRLKRDGAAQWPESGMNRYGVFANFPALETSASLDGFKVKPEVKHVGEGFEIRFPLQKETRVYGLGDVSRDNIQRRPGTYEVYVKNIYSYIPMPVAFTTEGWGFLVNSSWRHTIDVGKADPNAIVCTAKEGEADFYFFTGADHRAMLDTYTHLTGRSALLPVWNFGFTFVANQWIDQFALIDETMGFRDHEIPCDVIGLEPGWMETFYDFTTRKRWDSRRFYFPYWSPKGSLTFPAAMGRVGMKLSLWLCCNYDLFRYEEELVAGKNAGKKGEAVAGNNSDTWHDEHIEGAKKEKGGEAKPPRAAVSGGYAGDPEPYRYPEGVRPWFEHLRQFVDQGAQAFKLDGACQVTDWNGVPNRKWANGMKDDEAHNLYPLIYAKQMARGYEEYTGRRAMVNSAGGYAGVQQYVATWAGDTGGGVRPLISVLNLAMSGHSNQSCDMTVCDGGGKPAVCGLHFGFLAPWAQQNNWDYWDIPWVNPKEKVDAFRGYVNLRYRLVPYLYGTAANASRTGWPMVRALPLMHPDIREYDNCTDTYYLGDNLLVGVYAKEVTIPPGLWHEWRTDAEVKGPCRQPIEVTSNWGGALYVKAGAIIPTWPVKQYIEKGWNEEVIFEVWPTADGKAELYEDDGISLGYRKGEFALTPLTLEKTDAGAKFTVGARKGTFKGMPEKRRMRVRVHGAKEVREIDLGLVYASGKSITW